MAAVKGTGDRKSRRSPQDDAIASNKKAAQGTAHKPYGKAFRKLAERVSWLEPVFLSLDEVLEVHEQQIERYDGSGGRRDSIGCFSRMTKRELMVIFES
jgi:hypothetical protein